MAQLTDIDDEDLDVGSVSVTKDDADSGSDDSEQDEAEDAVDDEDDTDDEDLPKDKAAVQLHDGEDQDIDDDYQDVIEGEEDVDLVQLDSGLKGKKWNLILDDPKKPCKKIKYVKKKKKT